MRYTPSGIKLLLDLEAKGQSIERYTPPGIKLLPDLEAKGQM